MANSTTSKAVGFYVTIIVALLSLVTLVVYTATYLGSDYISLIALGLLIANVLINILLFALKRSKICSIVNAVLIGTATMFYIYGIYYYVSVVMTGIDVTTFDGRFIANSILFSVIFILSIANIFISAGKATNKKIVLTTIAGILVGFTGVLTVIAGENAGAISAFFGTETFRVVEADDVDYDTDYFKSTFNSLSDLIEAGKAAGEKAEAEGVVLLKNDNNALPLKEGSRRVNLLGITSVDPVYGGTGSGAVDTSSAPTFLDAFNDAGFSVNQQLWDFYTESIGFYGREALPGATFYESAGFTIGEVPWDDVEWEAGDSLAEYNNAAIIVFGRVGGEGGDLKSSGLDDWSATDGDYLRLSEDELSLLEGVAALKGEAYDKIIVLLNSANQLEASFINNPEYKIDAALWIGGVGQVGLNAVADIVAGDVVPSGHLSDMYWNDHSDNPVMQNFGTYQYTNGFDYGLEDPTFSNYVVYQEGVYLGYRYAETRYEDMVMGTPNAGDFNYNQVVQYPFGYGMSYTDFELSNFSVDKGRDGIYTAKIDVKNIGSDYSGKGVVQFYVQKPYTDYDRKNFIEKPSVELVEFAKTGNLAPGETETLSVNIDEQYFTSYDSYGEGTYILTDGDYYISAGVNAHDALNNILTAKGYSTTDGMDYNGNSDLVAKYSLGFDSNTYSVSKATGNKIENLFDFADLNRNKNAGDNHINYLSRSDWVGTANLTSNVEITLNDALMAELDSNTEMLKKDSIEYPKYGVNSGLMLIDMMMDSNGNKISFDDPVWDTFMDQLTWDETTELLSIGMRKTSAVASIAKPETVDHNGPSGLTQPYGAGPLGLAAKLDDPNKDQHPMCYPSNGIIAASFNKELAREIGDLIGEDALWAGYSGLYGTGVNMHRSPYQGRVFEYYSEDPILSGFMVREESAGIQDKGCYVYLKHFALNEQEKGRSGLATFVNEQTMREIYLRPFEISIREAGVKNVMAAFNRIGLEIAPSSDALLNGFLRGEAGLEGFVVTDFYRAYASTLIRANTVLAGCDLPDGDDNPAVFNDYKTGFGELAQGMRTSAKRILYTVVHSNAMNGISPGTQIISVTPIFLVILYVLNVVFALGFIAGILLILKNYKEK